MNSNRRRATTVAGWLYIMGTVAGVLSVANAVDSPDYLIKASANANQVTMAAFFQLLMAPAYVGIAISLYPVLRQYNPYLAFGFAGFRVIAGACILIGATSLMVILSLSRDFVSAGAPSASYYQTLGDLLQTGRDFVNHVATIFAVSSGGLMLYAVLYQTTLIPRWLSGWGLAGTVLTISATLLVLFRLIGIITTSYIALNLPMALQELVFAVWLIVKGFDTSSIDSRRRYRWNDRQ